ncbi:vanadium-dependent haloperoxidase [Flindersiella endophytica]
MTFVLLLATGAQPVSAGLDSGFDAGRLDPIRTWNELALNTVRTVRASDADAARTYAMVGVAVYDAVNGIASKRGSRARDFALKSPAGAPAHGDQQAAAVAAAHTVLTRLYSDRPDQLAVYDAQFAADLAQLGSGRGAVAGRAWGEQVGAFVVDARAGDGSRPVETQPAGSGPGVFPAAWPGVQYRNVTPFAIADAAPYVGAGPPALGSLDYAAAFAYIRLVGDFDIPDAEKSATYQYWSLGTGTVQPPGEWVRIALQLTAEHPVGLEAQSRLFALLTMALADTSVATVRTKYVFRHWRPESAIRQADLDGNPYTEPVPTWRARAGSPGSSPEYVSGHSVYSAAGASVIAGFYCDDLLSFTHASDSAPIDPATGLPMARSFPSLSAAAAEAGSSRVVGGLHFDFSNRDGLAMGRGVAAEVLRTQLLFTSGPTHVGACPR